MDLDKGVDMDQQLNTEQQIQTSRPSNIDGGAAQARVAPLAKQKVDAETNTSAEDECQSDWSLDQCQELLGEAVAAEMPRFHAPDEERDEPMEEMQESLSKLSPDAKENLADNSVVEICTRDTGSLKMPLKKNPVESVGQECWTKPLPTEPDNGAVLANEDPAPQKSNPSDEFDPKQINEFNSTEVKTDAKQKIPEEPPIAGNIAVLFAWIYNYARLANDCMAMMKTSLKIKQRDLAMKATY